MIEEQEALGIARQAIENKVELQAGAGIVAERRGKTWIITFLHQTLPHELGPDYDARVTIDARSGEVKEILGGP